MAIDLAALRRTFFEECQELLQEAEQALASLDTRADAETLNAIFRAVHSIKGGAGAFQLDALVGYAHGLETVMDRVRDGRLALTPAIIALLVRANDILADHVQAARNETPLPAGHDAEISAELHALLDLPAEQQAPPPPAPESAAQRHRIRFAPDGMLYRSGGEPRLLLRHLASLGTLHQACDTSRIPALADFQEDQAYLSWEMTLAGSASTTELQEVFEFVADDCRLEITADTATEAPSAATATPEVTTTTGPARREAAGTSVRVDLDRIDRLVNLVGEMATTQAMLIEHISSLPQDQHPGLFQAVDAMWRHVRELQEGVMAVRAQPVGAVFARLPRLVREAAAALGKDIRLVTSGESTELDRTVIERLGDPLTHMIRNACDHGLEPTEDRIAAGKPPQGTIHISAEHRAGRIIVEVSDDGRGLSRPRILARARERGLIGPETQPPGEEIDEMIFLPGFSTAPEVSAISGRGVGLDVVKSNIEALGGRIALTSSPGRGTSFSLSLPLTLAVLEGMVIRVGAHSYVVPLTSIVESLRLNPRDMHAIAGLGEVLAIRGQQLPVLRLRERFGLPPAEDSAEDGAGDGLVMVVEALGGRRLGLVVDELVGQQQVVIKSLETNFRRVPGIAAATILGNGMVALILDLATLGTAFAAPRLAA